MNPADVTMVPVQAFRNDVSLASDHGYMELIVCNVALDSCTASHEWCIRLVRDAVDTHHQQYQHASTTRKACRHCGSGMSSIAALGYDVDCAAVFRLAVESHRSSQLCLVK